MTDQIVSEIEQIFTFRIPYYVGPLNPTSDKFAWLVRRSHEPIRPWNFEKVVDVEQSSEKFIRRMTNKCTYMLGEDVLPKESLLYSEYLVRNALNTLMIDGNRLDKETRDYLFDTLFLNRKGSGKVTKKRIASTLKNNGIKTTEHNITGMDEEIPHKLKARHDFNRILTTPLSDKDIDNIIERITLFPDEPKMIKQWLVKEYGDTLSAGEISDISKLKYTGWGRFSRKFLSGMKHVTEDAIVYNLLEYMRDYPENLMEIINNKSLAFYKEMEEHNKDKIKDNLSIDDEYLDNLYLSPSVKKAVRKVALLVRELIDIMGGAPERVFIEMTRTEGEKQRTKPRKTQVDELYKALKSMTKDFDEEIKSRSEHARENWEKQKTNLQEDQLKSKKLYLYYRQWGRCMYSGAPINLNDLFNGDKYDIDHIYPRSLSKDDSWNNLVLVTQEENRRKKNNFPIQSDVQSRMHSFWSALLQGGFITSENNVNSCGDLKFRQLETSARDIRRESTRRLSNNHDV